MTLTATSTVEVRMPDGSIRTAGMRPVTEDDIMPNLLGYTHWPHMEGYEIGQTGAGLNWSAKPDNYIEVFGDYHAPTTRYARVGNEWFSFPAISGGWAQRRPWHPSPVGAERMSRLENMTTFYGLPWLAEETYGLPRDRIVTCKPEDYEALLAGDPA